MAITIRVITGASASPTAAPIGGLVELEGALEEALRHPPMSGEVYSVARCAPDWVNISLSEAVDGNRLQRRKDVSLRRRGARSRA